MPNIADTPVKKVTLHTAVFLSGLTFLAGFFTAMVLPVGRGPVATFRTSEGADTKDLDERIRVLEAETEKSPLDEKLWAELGDLYNDSSLIDKAIFAYQKVLVVNPNNADAWAEMGTLHHKSGRPDKAVEAFDRAIAVDSKHESSRFIKGYVLMHDLKDRDGAMKSWEELLEINPLAMAPNGQSVDQLIQHYREHVKKNP